MKKERLTAGSTHASFKRCASCSKFCHSCITFYVSSDASALPQGLMCQVSICVSYSQHCAFSEVFPSPHVRSQPGGRAWASVYFSSLWKLSQGFTATIPVAEPGLAAKPPLTKQVWRRPRAIGKNAIIEADCAENVKISSSEGCRVPFQNQRDCPY